MKPLFAVLFACIGASALADAPGPGDWRQANERVEEAGGWKAYAREIHKANSNRPEPSVSLETLSLQLAIDRALTLNPSLKQILSSTPREPARYLLLSSQQKAALTREAHLIAEVAALWYEAVAGKEHVAQQTQVTEVASIASELSDRMQKVGNLNTLHQAEDQLSYAKTKTDLARSQLALEEAMEKLALRLQISGDPMQIGLPARLPEPPSSLESLKLSNTDAALLSTEIDNPSVLRLLSETRRAIHEREEAFRLVSHYKDEVLPLQRRISEEHLLHYNGMIIGIFELLKDAKQQTKAVDSYLAALGSYWKADAALLPKLAALREQLSEIRRDAWK
jgi:outer membrane protein TolC